MTSSQSSSLVNNFVLESPTWWYGLKAPIKTSHTKKNPRRRIFACPKYNTDDARCEFFVWADILKLLEENFFKRENKASKMWDDVLQCEYDVRKMEDKVRNSEESENSNAKIIVFVLGGDLCNIACLVRINSM